MTLSDWPLSILGTAAFVFFLLAKYIYRVTLHPLASFPGPRWAALTSLYGAYYDLHPDRSYCKHFPALHDRYGPIVKLWPNELHIRDIDAYSQLFKIGSNHDKYVPFYSSPQLDGGYFSIGSTKKALARKNMVTPLLTKEAIRRSEFLITDMLAKFLKQLSCCASGARPVDLSMGFSCLAADVSMNLAFQRPFNALDAEGFQSELVKAIEGSFTTAQWPFNYPTLFRGLYWVIIRLPKWFASRFVTSIVLAKSCLEISRGQILYLQGRSASEGDIRTVFNINLHPNLEKGQFTPTVDEMTSDALGLLTAGTLTTSHTLVVISWALLNNPQISQKLKAELRAAMPGRNDTLDWAELEKLPYLRAVIREGLRVAYGAPGHLPRVVPSSGAVFCGQKIPAGTIVSSSALPYHLDPHTFTDPKTFRPERWLGDAAGDLGEMDRKFIPFSRGSRSCTGMHVAYAELYLTLAHVFRRFEISNNGTTDADLEWKDCLVPIPKRHLKVTVKEAVD